MNLEKRIQHAKSHLDQLYRHKEKLVELRESTYDLDNSIKETALQVKNLIFSGSDAPEQPVPVESVF